MYVARDPGRVAAALAANAKVCRFGASRVAQWFKGAVLQLQLCHQRHWLCNSATGRSVGRRTIGLGPARSAR